MALRVIEDTKLVKIIQNSPTGISAAVCASIGLNQQLSQVTDRVELVKNNQVKPSHQVKSLTPTTVLNTTTTVNHNESGHSNSYHQNHYNNSTVYIIKNNFNPVEK